MGCGGSTPTAQDKKPPLECPVAREELEEKGWHHHVLEEGTGSPVLKGKKFTMDFKGYLADPPYTSFGQGDDKVIDKAGKGLVKGMNEGVLLMKEGETAIISCAPSHGYGDKAAPGIPVGSVLLFKVTIKTVG
ncbi:FK506-binding protein 1 [Diplonema papillatum]|nr:FK506-binding protein 1 [Diplonema papillatum]